MKSHCDWHFGNGVSGGRRINLQNYAQILHQGRLNEMASHSNGIFGTKPNDLCN